MERRIPKQAWISGITGLYKMCNEQGKQAILNILIKNRSDAFADQSPITDHTVKRIMGGMSQAEIENAASDLKKIGFSPKF